MANGPIPTAEGVELMAKKLHEQALRFTQTTAMHPHFKAPLMQELDQAMRAATLEATKLANGDDNDVADAVRKLEETARKLETVGTENGEKYPRGSTNDFLATYKTAVDYALAGLTVTGKGAGRGR